MLTVNSAKFHKSTDFHPNKIGNIAGNVNFGAEYDSLEFETYPLPAQTFILAIDYHAEGNVSGLMSIRIRRGDQVIHTTSLSSFRAESNVGEGNFGVINNIKDVVIPEPGYYEFDIVFNDAVLYSAHLTFKESKIKKQRKRH